MLPELGLWLEINYNFINNQIFFFKKGELQKQDEIQTKKF